MITFDETAEIVVHEVCTELLQHSAGGLAVLSIQWSPGNRENRRGPNGESIWETIESAGWTAQIGAYDQPKASSVLTHTTVVNGIHVLVHPKAGKLDGTFVISAENRRLHVKYQEA